jgi:hypothetical protein
MIHRARELISLSHTRLFFFLQIIFIPCILFCVNMGGVYGWTVAVDEAVRLRTRGAALF